MTIFSLVELHRLGRHEEVLQLAQSLEVRAADDPQSTLIVAASLFQLQRFSDSLKILAVLEPLIRSDETYLNLLALCLWRHGDLERSEQVFNYALTQHAGHLVISNNCIRFLIDRQKYSQARSVLERALQQHPQDEDLQASRLRLHDLEASQSLENGGAGSGKTLALPPSQSTPAPNAPTSPSLPSSTSPSPQPQSPPGGAGAAVTDELVSLPESATTQVVPAKDPVLAVAPPQKPTTIDPLLLAFSQEEVSLDQDNRRRHRDARNQDTDQVLLLSEGSKLAHEALPSLPEPPLQDVTEELLKVIREALIEKQYECALAVADHVRRLDPSKQVELYRLCSEAYAGLGNLPTSELCLQTLAVMGELEDVDRLNLAGMALRRHELGLAEHYLLDFKNPELHTANLLALQEKIQQRRSEPQPSLVFSPKGLKAVRVRSEGRRHSDTVDVKQPVAVDERQPKGSHPSSSTVQTVQPQVAADLDLPPAQAEIKPAAPTRQRGNGRKSKPSVSLVKTEGGDDMEAQSDRASPAGASRSNAQP